MLYIVGLGNPGQEYESTRHNIGRMALEYITEKLGYDSTEWKMDKILQGKKIKIQIGDTSAFCLTPDTFMNKSGQSVKPFIFGSQVPSEKKLSKLLVIQDDLDLPLGKIKIVHNRSSGGHRGIESICKAVKSECFSRIKIGVLPTTPTGKLKKPKTGEKVIDFILGEFQSHELAQIKKEIHPSVFEMVECIAKDGVLRAMNEFNGK